jgi:hypothetical protein
MTMASVVLQECDYLAILVRDYGLQKVSFHVDATQRGRPGWRREQREEELHPLRDRFADLVRQTRQETGCVLHAATTCGGGAGRSCLGSMHHATGPAGVCAWDPYG